MRVTHMRVTKEPMDVGMVVPSPLGWTPIPTRRRRPWVWGVGAITVLVVAFAVLNAITVPYYGILPGEALAVDGPQGAVSVGARRVGSGNLFLATVLLQSRISEWDRLTDFLHHQNDIVPQDLVTGGATATQYNQQNAQAMSDSQEFAKVAALRRLGYAVPELGDGAAVVGVASRTPAAGVLEAGDVITAIDASPVNISSDVTAAISVHQAGEAIRVTIRRPNPSGSTTKRLTLRPVACGSACPGDATRPLIGIEVTTDRQSFGLPTGVKLSIATNGIGGPSAGLAFTLGAIDGLIGHDITGGHRVAATGTIDPGGVVGEVGGVKQKTIAVEAQHCEYFIVPRAEYADAKAAAHRLTIVAVDNLEQALDFLHGIHGNLEGIPGIGAAPAAQ